ncbi:MAG TPA: DUF3413 domain-containing protein [Aliidiomarina sp.]|nr:DUF3413 domain-containing protein [Aliidiomarina sp.]
MTSHQHRERIAKSISWGHWFTFANIFLALLIGTLYFNSASTTGSTLARLYLFVSWLGHFAFLPFAFFIVLIFPFCLAFPYSRFLRGLGAIIASFSLFALLLDAVFFQYYQFHLNTYAIAQLATDAELWFTGGSFVILMAAILSFLVIFAVQILLTNITWKKLDDLRQMRTFRVMPAVFVLSFFLSHCIHIWADATVFKPITQQDDLFPLSYPSTAKSLMTRHGWIDMSSLDRQRSEAAQDATTRLRYPLNPLLCARQSQAAPTLFIVFEHLTAAHIQTITAALPQLEKFKGTVIGHPQEAAGFFQFTYGIPDRYLEMFNQQGIAPAYSNTLNDFDYPVHWATSLSFQQNALPEAIRLFLPENSVPSIHTTGISVVFANANDLSQGIDHIKDVLTKQPNTAIYITAVTPRLEMEIESNPVAVTERLAVPLFTHNVTVYPERALAQLNDLVPTALSTYMSCAEDSRSYSNGIHLNSPTNGYPRVSSINPSIYLFEHNKTSVLNAEGNVEVYDNAGKIMAGEQPTTTVLIQGLSELQRFSTPRRKQ